jgi:hypothetical protein
VLRKQRLLALHRWAALIAGVVLAAMGLSGATLVYKTEIEAWAHPERHVSPGTPRFEAVSRVYQIDVLVRCTADKSADLERDLLGQRVHLFIGGTTTRTLHGFGGQVEFARLSDVRFERAWRVRIVPRIAFLGQTKQSRVFQD